MRVKLTFYGLRLMVMLLLCSAAVTIQAQNNYFSVVNGMPHLPVFANTAAVPAASLKPGAMIYSTADAGVMIYSGDTWATFCTQQLALTSGGYPQFTVVGGVPCLPVMSTTAVASTTGTSGALYYPTDKEGVRINNSLNWFTPNTLAATPVVTASLTAGNLSGLAGAVAIPVKAANPSFVAADKGTVYLNSTDFKLHVNNGTAWVAVDCSVCPAVASNATVNIDDPVNMNAIAGGYSYFQKQGVAEGTSVYRWRTANDALGTGAALTGITTVAYTPGYTDALEGKYLQFDVRPLASSGTLLGSVATSPWTLIHNCQPQVGSAAIAGDIANMSSNTFSNGGYSYYDQEGNAENTSGLIYRWFLSTVAGGNGTVTALSTGTGTNNASGTNYTYTYTDADDGKYLNLGVRTMAAKGYSTSNEYIASYLLKNCPPQAGGVLVEPVDITFSAPTIINVSFSYNDVEGNLEGSALLSWYKADDAAGTINKTVVATGSTSGGSYAYTYSDADNGKYLLAAVTPKAVTGYTTGAVATSPGVMIWNCPPQVSGLIIEGTFTVGSTVAAGYIYYDKEGNAEGTSTYQWYRGSTSTPISGATSSSYVLTSADKGYTIGVGVTPKAAAGYSTGTQVTTFSSTTIP